MGRFRAWLKKLLGLNTKSKPKPKLSTDPPPFLPTPRSRPLTPVFTESVGVQLRPQPQKCLLFAEVPGDLRLTILNMAFAGRRIHMDLVFDNGLLHAYPSEKRHANISPHDYFWVGNHAWRWAGCVCHRYDPIRTVREDVLFPRIEPTAPTGSLLMYLNWQGPRYDYCMRGNNNHCPREEGAWPGECQVGIMGFLLSCRQAYAEGIHVLFAGNCISISSTTLLTHLPRLILPQRLEVVTSLEVSVHANETVSNHRLKWDLDHLPPILDNIVTYCRHLRRINIAVGGLFNFEFIDDDPLIHLDAFYRSMQLREMMVELPERNMERYQRRGVQAMHRHPSEPLEADDTHYCIWRCLDGEMPQAQQRHVGTYPSPPPKTRTIEDRRGNVPSSGYWVRGTEAITERKFWDTFPLDSESDDD